MLNCLLLPLLLLPCHRCRNGFLAVVFSLCSLLPMSCFFYMELCTIAAYGWGWLKAWNVLDMVRTCCVFITSVSGGGSTTACIARLQGGCRG